MPPWVPVPGSFSTISAVMPACGGSAAGSVFTSSAMSPARAPLVTHIFCPLMTSSSPSRRAVVRIARTSEPASGSVIMKQQRRSPAAIVGRYLLPLLVRAVAGQHATHDVHAVDDAGDRHPASRKLCDCERVGRQIEPEATVLLRDAHAEQAHLAQALHDLFGVLVACLEVMGDRDDLAVDEVAHGVQDVELLVLEIEAIEAADPLAHVPLLLLSNRSDL